MRHPDFENTLVMCAGIAMGLAACSDVGRSTPTGDAGTFAGTDAGTGSCVEGPESSESACSDGCSNDGDAEIDCADPDCSAACPAPGPACPLPALATGATRDDPDPLRIDLTVANDGTLTHVEGEPCELTTSRPRTLELYDRPPLSCVATYRCGACLWSYRDESRAAEGSFNAFYVWSDRATDDATEPACPAYSPHLYTLEMPPGNPFDRGPSDPWKNCEALGGVRGPNGACLITDCARCPSDAACRSGGLSYCLPTADCTRDADCPRGWQCQQITSSSSGCRIPCTAETSGASPECPVSLGCTGDAAGGPEHWCVDRDYQQRVCTECLDVCRGTGLPGCCCGAGCLCEAECQSCRYF